MNPYPKHNSHRDTADIWECFACEDEEIHRYYDNKHEPLPPVPDPGPSTEEMVEAADDLKKMIEDLEKV